MPLFCNESNQRCISSAFILLYLSAFAFKLCCKSFFLAKSLEYYMHHPELLEWFIKPQRQRMIAIKKKSESSEHTVRTQALMAVLQPTGFLYDKLVEHNKIASPQFPRFTLWDLFLIYTLYSEGTEVLKCTHSPWRVCHCAINLFHHARCSSM